MKMLWKSTSHFGEYGVDAHARKSLEILNDNGTMCPTSVRFSGSAEVAIDKF